MGAVRVILSMWLAYLALIYVDGLPGGAGFVSMAVPFVMAFATMPQASVSLLFVPSRCECAFRRSGVYLRDATAIEFHGPRATDLWGDLRHLLSLRAPRQALGRIFGLALFVTIASITNEQTYSFLKVANTALMFPLMFLHYGNHCERSLSPAPRTGISASARPLFPQLRLPDVHHALGPAAAGNAT